MIDHDIVLPKQKPMPKNMQSDPLLVPTISMVIGSTGSGKSTIMANLLLALQKRHDFDSGLFVTSNNRDTILDSIEMPITTSPKELEDYIIKLKQAKEGTKHILILDDIQGSTDFKIMLGRSLFANFLLSHRHYGSDKAKPNQFGVWVILTAQTLKNSFSPVIRDQVKQFFLFYPRKPVDVKFYEDLVSDAVVMRRAMGIVKTDSKHSFLFLNKHDSAHNRYFLGFSTELVDLS